MSNVTSTPQYFSSTTDITFDADTEYSKHEGGQSTLFTMPAQQTPQELADARDLKAKIAVFLNKHLGKSSSKSRNIVQKLPTNDPHQLNNILKALNTLRMDTERFGRLNENLSWASSFQDFMLCQCCKDTSAEDRLVLRALILFNFAGINAGLYDDHRSDYLGALRWATTDLYTIRTRNHGELSRLLHGYEADMKMHPNNVAYKAQVAVLPTILSEMEKLYRD